MIGLLNKTATITPQTWSKTADGHPDKTAGATSPVKCSLQTLSTNESLRHQQNESDELMALYVIAGSGITPKDTVTVDSKTFKVRSLLEDMGGRGRLEKWLVHRTVE